MLVEGPYMRAARAIVVIHVTAGSAIRDKQARRRSSTGRAGLNGHGDASASVRGARTSQDW